MKIEIPHMAWWALVLTRGGRKTVIGRYFGTRPGLAAVLELENIPRNRKGYSIEEVGSL